MKNIIKRYYELDDETKELLEPLYMFHELESSMDDYENVEINNLGDEEAILEIATSCSYLTNLGSDVIIRRILEILNCSDVSINDLKELKSDELIELLQNADDNINTTKIITEFTFNNLFCVLLKDKEKYILTYQKNNTDSRVLIFNNLEQLLSIIIQRDFILSKAES